MPGRAARWQLELCSRQWRGPLRSLQGRLPKGADRMYAMPSSSGERAGDEWGGGRGPGERCWVVGGRRGPNPLDDGHLPCPRGQCSRRCHRVPALVALAPSLSTDLNHRRRRRRGRPATCPVVPGSGVWHAGRLRPLVHPLVLLLLLLLRILVQGLLGPPAQPHPVASALSRLHRRHLSQDSGRILPVPRRLSQLCQRALAGALRYVHRLARHSQRRLAAAHLH